MRSKSLAFLKIIYYFCDVNECCIHIYTKSKDLPPLLEGNFFHSRELFLIYEQTPGCKPFMVVASDLQNNTLAQLLVAVNRKGNWLPPFIYTHTHTRKASMLKKKTRNCYFGKCFKPSHIGSIAVCASTSNFRV